VRYTAFLLLGLLLIALQGEVYLILGPLAAKGFRPSLLIPLLVYLGVTETNLALGAAVAFLLGYVLDVVGGAPIGLYTFACVATVALARIANFRVVTQGGVQRALLAGAFAALSSVIVLVLLAIFGKSGYVPRAMARLVIPHAVATIVVAPLVFRAAARVQMLASGYLDPTRVPEQRKLVAPRTDPVEDLK
jgi:rod shape-determining protein MreD